MTVTRNKKGINETIRDYVKSLEAELSATKEKLEAVAHAMHYPAHWDDAAYPTLVSAITEAFACSVCADPVAHGYDSVSHPYHIKT